MASTSTSSARTRRLAVAVALCALISGLIALTAGAQPGHAQDHAPLAKPGKGGKGGKGGKTNYKQPNIVVIVTDDQAKSTVIPEAMPNLFTRLMPRGTTFSDYVVTTPLCCPSRAAYMTGQYGHNNGILRNVYGDLIQKRNVLPAWLKYAGYNTAHVGKFLNGYEQGKLGPAAVAPGFDLWFTELEKRRYYNWKASKNGKIRHYGTDDNDHVTKVTSDFAVRWTKRLARKKDPFYMQVDYYAPHTSTGRDTRCASSPVPEPVDEHRFDAYPLPTPPNFNELDVSDKPNDVKGRGLLTSDNTLEIERRYRCTLESVYGIDRGLGRIMDVLKQRRELDNTVIVFTSDNGYFYGEHRIAKGKPDPYEENINMPLTIAIPNRFRGLAGLVSTSDASVANIDLAPTLLELAGTGPCRTPKICRTMDGRSMMPLMDGSGGFPNPRPIALELYDCDYRGVRYDRQMYTEYSAYNEAGTCTRTDTEYYDLRSDPYQMENGFPAASGSPTAAQISQMQQLEARMTVCAGIKGRDPKPASGQYCG